MKWHDASYTFLFVLVLYGNAFAELPAVPTFEGSYTGVLHHQRLGKDQLARLDFIASKEAGYVNQVMAVLTLYLGDFTSREYVSFHFDNVRLNALTKQLVFDQPDQPVTLTARHFQDGKFDGHFRSALFGDVGDLELTLGNQATPKQPLISRVWGLYRGDCTTEYASGDTYLQLVTARTSADVAPVSNPFGSYQITGDVSWRSDICLGQYCPAGKVTQGSYNFYSGDLRLLGRPNFQCRVEANALVCNRTCRFERVTPDAAPVTAFPRARAEFETAAKDLPGLTGEAAEASGEYVGYLHHEFLDTYQAGKLNIASYLVPSSGDPTLNEFHLSAVATLFFGDAGSAESLSYQFDERKYPNPITKPVFVFSRPASHVDAILQVRELGNGVVRGDWYSLLFGRVGSFEFRKAEQKALTLSTGAKRLAPLSATYGDGLFELKVLVADLASVPVHPYNPFQPLSFGGSIKSESVPPRLVTGGSYDFYTGAVSLTVEGGSALTGWRDERSLKLRPYTPSLAPAFMVGDIVDDYTYRGE